MAHTRLRPSFAVTEERLAQLKAVIPEAFADGKVNWTTLRESLGERLEDEGEEAEHFGLFWPGKRSARRLGGMPSRGTLVPVQGEGVNEGTTRNFFVEGDNLEVLKLLQKSYGGQIKMIYIDPPYNTGSDFIYSDDFTDPLGEYLRKTGQADEEGRPLTTNTRADGRFHSNWLSMMYPRLRLGRELVREDGFIVVSIDDGEIAALRLLMNEIFGEENWLATLVWDRNRKNDARFFSVGHEYMLVYARSKEFLVEQDVLLRATKEGIEEVRQEWERLRKVTRDSWDRVRIGLREYFDRLPEDDPRRQLARYSKVDERGPFRDDGNINWPGGGGPRYEVLHPTTRKPCKKPRSGWRYPTLERFFEKVREGVVVFGPDETTVPRIRTNLFEQTDQVLGTVHYSYAQTAAQQFDQIFGGNRVFDNPKPYADLKQLVEYLTAEDDIVMDFFAGSGSLGHGCLAANRATSQTRHFILVQWPEAVDTDGATGRNAVALQMMTIADICKERLRRVIRQMETEGQSSPLEDLGFKALRLVESSFAAWEDYADGDPAELQLAFDRAENSLVPNWSPDGLLMEVQLLEGFALDSTVAPLSGVKSNHVTSVTSDFSSHRLLACFDKSLKDSTVDGINLQAEDVFVCLDTALSDEQKLRLADRCNLKTI